MNLTVNEDIGAAYLYLHEQAPIARTITVHANLDLDNDGNVVGIEILGWPSKKNSRQKLDVRQAEWDVIT